MKITAIIQARSGSTRLPEKIFKELFGKPILWHVHNRVQQSKLISQIVIATTNLSEDDKVEEFCVSNDFLFYRGSSDDVLSRYYEAAKKFNADIIIRITSDCPVIDPVILDKMIETYLKEQKENGIDYLSNTIHRTFPRGLDVEILTMSVLEKIFNEANKQYEREHVTPYIYQHTNIFKIKNFENDKDLSHLRLTVDTSEDFKLIEIIYDEIYPQKKNFLLDDVEKLLERKPELADINKFVEQKKLGE
jgi:spore coat polysaccharide biosynthesis protein SpsF